jgi:hypothetical protein
VLDLHALLRDAVNPSLGAPWLAVHGSHGPQKRMETEHVSVTFASHAALRAAPASHIRRADAARHTAMLAAVDGEVVYRSCPRPERGIEG